MLFQLASQVLFQPFTNVRILMQLGFEPLPLQPGISFSGEKKLYLPNAFKYMNYIYEKNGFESLFTGLLPRLCQQYIAVSLSETDYMQDEYNELDNTLPNKIGFVDNLDVDVDEFYTYVRVPGLSNYCQSKEFNFNRNPGFKTLFSRIKKQSLKKCYSLVLTYPFQLISIRMVGQLVGNETKYNGLIDSIVVIFKEEGLTGFYQGFWSKLLTELTFIASMSVGMFFLKKYLLPRSKNHVVLPIFSYLLRQFLYPLELVSTCMAVNNTGLKIASQPFTIYFNDDFECYQYLSATNQLKRGHRLFNRSLADKAFKYSPRSYF